MKVETLMTELKGNLPFAGKYTALRFCMYPLKSSKEFSCMLKFAVNTLKISVR